MILTQQFYQQNTLDVARQLLGKTVVREIGNHFLTAKIVETEAYAGFDDKASHAHSGKTPRCNVMFGPAGFAYVYFTYGMHYLFNVVTEDVNYPSAVLIRAVEPITGLEIIKEHRKNRTYHELTSGPAKFTKAFGIDKNFNGLDLTSGKVMWIEGGEEVQDDGIKITPRIGVSYAEECKDWLRRFYVKGSRFVSKD